MDTPPEIALKIVYLVQSTDLRSIGLSCRAFRGPAQLRIFDKVDLFNGGSFCPARFRRISEVLEANPSLADFVHELTIDPLTIRPNHLVVFLKKLSNLRSLHLQSTGSLCNLPIRILQVIKETICTPNLTRLSIAEFSTFPIALLNGVGFIQELEVSSVKFHPYPREIDGPQAHAPLSKLESLCLLDYGKAADIKLLPLLELIPRKLKRLRVGCGRMYEGPCLKLFQAIGGLPILQHFVYSLSPFRENASIMQAFLHPSLKHFEFDFTEWQLAHPDEASTINLLQKVSEMLNHANPLPSLEQISIKNWIPEGKISLKYFHHPILARMEGRLLRPERFPQLARLHIICSYSTNDFWGTQVDEMEANLRTVVELAMPELHKRGCLLVVLCPHREPSLGFSGL